MADATAAAPDAATAIDAASDSVSFFANILTPGSSFHPTFLLIADAAFLGLFFVLLALLFVTQSLHFAVLILVEAGLWLSVKWFVNELRKAEMEVRASAEKKDT
ncbi:ER protein Pkr1-domain-containing protein [Schizophyllum commune]